MALILLPGISYRVVTTFSIGRCVFRAGEVFTFTSGGYSPYDDCYVYEFVDSSGEKRLCASQTDLSETEQANFEPTR